MRLAAVAAALLLHLAAPAAAQTVGAGALRATLDGDRAVLTDARGEAVVVARRSAQSLRRAKA